jgi:hypothetical protein
MISGLFGQRTPTTAAPIVNVKSAGIVSTLNDSEGYTWFR